MCLSRSQTSILSYGSDVIDPEGAIPSHLMGTMLGAYWTNILHMVKPFPNKLDLDVTPYELKRLNWTTMTMFEEAENFFLSMGLPPMPEVRLQSYFYGDPSQS